MVGSETVLPGSQDLRLAESLVRLMSLPRVGHGRAIKIAEAFGTWESLRSASPDVLRRAAGIRIESVPDEPPPLPYGVRLLGWFDADYPRALRSLSNPPAVLWVRGDLAPTRPRIAVVGTRKPTPWGTRVATAVAQEAARRGISVVSGLALGVDIAAHRAAVKSGGHTIAVLGGGVDSPTPRQHERDAEQLLSAGGALIAEVPPGLKPSARTLVARNRLQAGLSRVTVMVQCGLSSGTVHTARFTTSQGKALAVAQPPDAEVEAPENAGNVAMLSSQGTGETPTATHTLTSLDDIVALLELTLP